MAIPKTIDYSPKTKTSGVTAIDAVVFTIDDTVEQGIDSFPDASVAAPGTATLCTSEGFDSEDPADYETIEYTERDVANKQLKGVTRQKAGTAREWPAGSFIAAYVPGYAYNALVTAVAEAEGDISDHVSNTTTAHGLNTHTGNTTTAHGAVSAATANKLMVRDASGRAQVADPSADADIANKGYADGIVRGFKNAIINGDFRINQRGHTSGGTLAAGAYGHDRWKAGTGGCNYTFATVENKTTITIPATRELMQIIEGQNLQSGSYTLSWEGTAQAKIGAGSYADSPITASVTGGADLTITFGAGTVANVQLEQGSVATPFEQRPLGLELSLCQRYYEQSYDIGVSTKTFSENTGQHIQFSHISAFGGVTFLFRAAKRTNTPTFRIYDRAGALNKISYWSGSAYYDGGTTIVKEAKRYGAYVFHTMSSSTIVLFAYTCDDEL